jgi:hypothetical protein
MTKTFDLLRNELTATASGFLSAIAGISPAQGNFEPAPDRWSIRYTAEHVTLVELGVKRLLTGGRLLQSPIPEGERPGFKSRDMLVTASLFDRTRRLHAPEAVRPTGRWPEMTSVRQSFEEARSAIIDWLENTGIDLRGYSGPHPILGPLDGKQWLLFAAAHAARHTRQILEIKAAPGWPPG